MYTTSLICSVSMSFFWSVVGIRGTFSRLHCFMQEKVTYVYSLSSSDDASIVGHLDSCFVFFVHHEFGGRCLSFVHHVC